MSDREEKLAPNYYPPPCTTHPISIKRYLLIETYFYNCFDVEKMLCFFLNKNASLNLKILKKIVF